MNNLPSNMRRHTVFRDNDYTHTVVFPDSYLLPATNEIKMQVRYNGRILTDIDPEISVTGQRVNYTYSPEMLGKIPSIVQQYLTLAGKSFIGGELGVLVGYGEQDISETHVTIVDGEVTVVEVMGLALVEAQVDLAAQKANEASASAATSAEWAQAAGGFSASAGNSASTATTQAGIATAGASTATTKAAEANASAEAATAAKDEAIQVLAQKLDNYFVNTYSDLVAFVSDPDTGPCGILVLSDESYEVGVPRWHMYKGTGGVSGLVRFITYTENA